MDEGDMLPGGPFPSKSYEHQHPSIFYFHRLFRGISEGQLMGLAGREQGAK